MFGITGVFQSSVLLSKPHVILSVSAFVDYDAIAFHVSCQLKRHCVSKGKKCQKMIAYPEKPAVQVHQPLFCPP
jgi:hypothetical protein